MLATAAASDPVTLAEAKAYCMVDGTNDNDLITAFISSATNAVQLIIAQQFIQATFDETWDYFPCEFTLDRSPLASVSYVKYYDVDGTLTTISSANYHVDTYSRRPRIVPIESYVWPDTQCGKPSAVIVRYVAGYAGASSVPGTIKTAIMATVKHWYDNRGPIVTSGAIPKELPRHLNDLLALNSRNGYI